MKKKIKNLLLKTPFISSAVKRYHFTSNVHAELADATRVLELGCGVHSYLSTMKPRAYSVGVDIYEPSARLAKENGVYDEVLVMNVMEVGSQLPEKSFDVVMAMDLIEHLNKTDGEELLRIMERLARKKVIIYTPNGYLEQGEEYGNPWQRHLSGWTADEMLERGYRVTGWGGLKSLRPQFIITRKPRIVWRFIQSLTQLYAISHPAHAFQILCVKDVS